MSDDVIPEVDEIWFIAKELIACKRDELGNFLKIGTLFIESQKHGKYKLFGPHIMSFNDFITEMGYRKSTIYNAMACRREFGDEILANNLSIDPTRLVRLLPLRLTENEKVEWLMSASQLPSQGFEDAISSRKGKQTTDECEHTETEAWERCVKCRKFLKR